MYFASFLSLMFNKFDYENLSKSLALTTYSYPSIKQVFQWENMDTLFDGLDFLANMFCPILLCFLA